MNGSTLSAIQVQFDQEKMGTGLERNTHMSFIVQRRYTFSGVERLVSIEYTA
jgi:hypothetical protein